MGPVISADELARRVADGSVRVVDCRFSLADTEAGRRAYVADHIPGAVYAHLDDDLSGEVVPGKTGRHPLPEPDALARRLAEWGIANDSHVVAYDDAGGAIAARLWWLLGWLGHARAQVLDGGWAAWIERGHAVSSEPAAPPAASFVPRVRTDRVADVGEVERIRESGQHRLLDARAPERFRGDSEPIDPIAGHIPGARSLPLTDNLDGGRFRPPAAIRARFEAELAGVPVQSSVAYCGSGVTACHLVLAAEHAGLGGMRLYPGSWSEWIIDPSRPVARGE